MRTAGRNARFPASAGLHRAGGVCHADGCPGSIMILVPYWNWYGFPPDFTLGQIIEHAVGWLLAGIALAAMVRPAT